MDKKNCCLKDLYFFLSIMAFFLISPSILAAGEQDGPYLIGPEDILEISVWKDPDLTKQVVVRPDGRISFPLIGEVEAGDHSVEWLEKEIKKRIKEYVPDARVCVSVIQINSIKIYVTGKVTRPGEYRIGKKLNVIQAISLAGGISTFADANSILILRTENSSQNKIPFNYDKVKKGENLEQNIILETGDVVVVP
ncbi:MAG: polysaccharide export protein [Proteobacteria bacterium]|nr:polysaccharide export protein [Pseudomonadota bacterium]